MSGGGFPVGYTGTGFQIVAMNAGRDKAADGL